MCQLTCNPTEVISRESSALAVEYLLPSFVSKYTLTELQSATRYSCLLRASTLKGLGPSASVMVWTEPDGTYCVLCNLSHSTTVNDDDNDDDLGFVLVLSFHYMYVN